MLTSLKVCIASLIGKLYIMVHGADLGASDALHLSLAAAPLALKRGRDIRGRCAEWPLATARLAAGGPLAVAVPALICEWASARCCSSCTSAHGSERR